MSFTTRTRPTIEFHWSFISLSSAICLEWLWNIIKFHSHALISKIAIQIKTDGEVKARTVEWREKLSGSLQKSNIWARKDLHKSKSKKLKLIFNRHHTSCRRKFLLCAFLSPWKRRFDVVSRESGMIMVIVQMALRKMMLNIRMEIWFHRYARAMIPH